MQNNNNCNSFLAAQSLPVEQIRALDAAARDIGISETVLIENASSNLGTVIESLPLGKNVVVVAGRGNNGADVLCCARKLVSRGYMVKVLVLSQKPLGPQAQLQVDILRRLGIAVTDVGEDASAGFIEVVRKTDFVIDGLLGVGVSGEVSAFLRQLIQQINTHAKTVIACDIPSGLDPDSGKALGAAIKAAHTITFLAPKQGFFVNDGPQVCGSVHVVDIGISRKMLER